MLRGSECRVLAPGDARADEGAGAGDNARLLILGVAYGGAGGAEPSVDESGREPAVVFLKK
eukprot:COSAG04_NODE_171_length_21611_cov_4.302808_12_plen_61_part_00